MKNLFKVSLLCLCVVSMNLFGATDEAPNMGIFMKKYPFATRPACSVVEATAELDETNQSPDEKSAALRALFASHPEAKVAIDYVERNHFKKSESKQPQTLPATE